MRPNEVSVQARILAGRFGVGEVDSMVVVTDVGVWFMCVVVMRFGVDVVVGQGDECLDGLDWSNVRIQGSNWRLGDSREVNRVSQ